MSHLFPIFLSECSVFTFLFTITFTIAETVYKQENKKRKTTTRFIFILGGKLCV